MIDSSSERVFLLVSAPGIQCDVGHYQDDTGTTACVKCQTGYHMEVCPSAVRNSRWLTCLVAFGVFSSLASAAARPAWRARTPTRRASAPLVSHLNVLARMLDCVHRFRLGARAGTPCPAGRFQFGEGKSACDACTPGRANPAIGQVGRATNLINQLTWSDLGSCGVRAV